MPATEPLPLLHDLVYLDRDYIADRYEVVTGESPRTQVTKNLGKKASANSLFFSAELSAQETRSFPVSTFEMLRTLFNTLTEEPSLSPSAFATDAASHVGWVEGELSVFKSRSITKQHDGTETENARAQHFSIRDSSVNLGLALITTAEYFSSGLNNLLKMQDTVLKEFSLPVRAYVRVLPARGWHDGQWIAVPLVLIERRNRAAISGS
jgi:hypothetical protein